MNKPSYTFIINEASEYNPDWSCRDRLAFHAFNAKGLCAQKRLLDERVSNAVAKGLLKSGAILAASIPVSRSSSTTSPTTT